MVLFRKVRSRLIKLEKFKTYLIYALGEILLIVIGLLIAWKINDINESRKNRIVEVKIYKSLSQELNTNLGVLDSAIADYTKNIQTLQNTINYLGMEPAELTADAKSMIVNLNYHKTIVRDEAINSINATNKFEFIESSKSKNINQSNEDLTLQLFAIDIFKKKENFEIVLLFSKNAWYKVKAFFGLLKDDDDTYDSIDIDDNDTETDADETKK